MTPTANDSDQLMTSGESTADLVELSLLTQAASDVLTAIPAQRCIVYIYDKVANLLRPQVVVDCDDGETSNATTDMLDVEPSDASMKSTAERPGVAKTTLVSFPPVVGMVSSSFLQRRCLRMQEPNPHRTFHREYDAPKDIQVDSIICAPVILYRRVAAVIQLLNRLDASGDRRVFELEERAPTPQDVKNESSCEVQLRRLKTAKNILMTGFTMKDEQKLLHFTAHVAQAIEMNIKKIANSHREAKVREDKAKQALELLNALNGNITARLDDTEELMANVAEHTGPTIRTRRRATLMVMPSQKGMLTNMLSALAVIRRLQAMFRGRRQRRAEKFAEELERFRKQRERMHTLIVVQRMARPDPNSKPKAHDKPMAKTESRGSSRLRIGVDERKRSLPNPSKPPLTSGNNISPYSSRQQLPVTSHSRKEQEHHQQRVSAKKIQKVFRQHRHHQQQKRLSSVRSASAAKLSREMASIVKVQSLVRGNLARKRLRRALFSPHAPHIVCLRIAPSSSVEMSNQSSHDSPQPQQLRSRTCVYLMPERPRKIDLVHRQHSAVHKDRVEESCMPAMEIGTPRNHDRHIGVESRKLITRHNIFQTPMPPSRPRGGRPVPGIVWETPQRSEHELVTPGVEFVRHYRRLESPGVIQESDKICSPRKTCTTDKAGNKLPVLTSPRTPIGLQSPSYRPQLSGGKSSLLCCLLPAQPKRLSGGFAPLVVRPASPPQKLFQSKRVQSPPRSVSFASWSTDK